MKNDKYTFRCDTELKSRFQMLCKIAKVSPSDVLQDVMIEFCDNAEKIMGMDDITQLRELLINKMNIASSQIDDVESNFKKE